MPWALRARDVRPARRRRSAQGLRGGPDLLAGRFGEQVVEVLLGLVLVLVERVHQLGGEDLLGAGEHLLLARGEALVELADREVANDLGQLVDVARLDLVPVVLEPAVSLFLDLREGGLPGAPDLLYRVLLHALPPAPPPSLS